MAANVNNYIAAANAAVSKNVQIRKALADNKPNYANLANASVNQAARNRANVAANNASTAQTAIKAETLVEGEKIKADTEKDIRGINKKARMTGMLAGGAALLGIGAIEMNKEEEPDARLELVQQQSEYWKNRYEQAGKDIDEAEARYKSLGEQLDSGGKSTKSDTSSPSSTSTSGGQQNSGGTSSGNLSSLTDKDFDDLAFAVSSEAALGTDDEYGVAANIVTRLRSGKYGGSISEIINAPGQYEGVYKGLSKASPEIAARFKTPEGRQKIEQFITQLDGRTEFKGQSQLGNRVKAEDPMFDPKGNFYHYSWQ
jgi:hypothetical protein